MGRGLTIFAGTCASQLPKTSVDHPVLDPSGPETTVSSCVGPLRLAAVGALHTQGPEPKSSEIHQRKWGLLGFAHGHFPISKPAFLILDISTDQYWQAFSGCAAKGSCFARKNPGFARDLSIRYIRSTLRLNFHQIWLNIHLFHIYLMDTSNFYLPIDMKSTGYHRFFSWQPERYLGSEVRHDCQQRIAGPLIGMIWITMNHYEYPYIFVNFGVVYYW